MQRAEFIKLIGAKSDSGDYTPVACLLRNGYACAGFVNQSVNEQYTDVCILLNARMVDLRDPNRRTERGAIHDFGDFLEEFVVGMMKKKKKGIDPSDEDHDPYQERFGKSIPLTAVAFDEIAVVYPVTRIGNLLHQINVEAKADVEKVPSFMDIENNSLLIKILKTKLW